MITNTQIGKYKIKRSYKIHEKKLISIINKIYSTKRSEPLNIMDIGCAEGKFIELLIKNYKNSKILGIDISKELISLSKKKFKENSNINFKRKNVLNNSILNEHKQDIIIASGILSISTNFQNPLSNWIKMLKKNGHLFVFGCFNSAHVDTISYFKNYYTNSKWETGLNSFSTKTISNYLNKKKVEHKFVKFDININIKKSKNPLNSYTVKTHDNKLLLMTGANISKEMYYLIIKKK